MARQKNTGIGSVYYNKARRNWIASYNIVDLKTKKEKGCEKLFQQRKKQSDT